jgi:hypothetical protein
MSENAENSAGKQRGKPFPKGRSGNPKGKPQGARNRSTIAVQQLLEGESEALTRRCIDLALGGDSTALRLCMERIAPAPKDRAIRFPMPSETSRHDRSDESNASGRLAVDQARNTREGQIYEQTYGAGANPALQGVEPKLRTAAAGAAQKAADEFTKAQAAQRDLETFMSSARAGNKEAHAYLSPEGVLTLNTARGVTRVNRQEMEAFAGAGSLVDHIVGKVGKLTSGQSVPSDIIDDIESLNKQLSNNSATTYNQKLSSINQNYHSNFQPVAAAADWKTQAKNAKAGEVIKLPNGHTVKANGDGTFTPQ